MVTFGKWAYASSRPADGRRFFVCCSMILPSLRLNQNPSLSRSPFVILHLQLRFSQLPILILRTFFLGKRKCPNQSYRPHRSTLALSLRDPSLLHLQHLATSNVLSGYRALRCLPVSLSTPGSSRKLTTIVVYITNMPWINALYTDSAAIRSLRRLF